MRWVVLLVFSTLVFLGTGCAGWSPFVRDSKCQRMWGYPPEKLAQWLNIPAKDRSRLEDFYGDGAALKPAP